MGNSASTPAQQCLTQAVPQVAFQSNPLFQLSYVKPYNLGIPVTPAAVTYPTTTDQVSAIVKCAVEYNLKVQPRCGGHSFANYGIGGQDNSIVVDLKNFQQFSMDKTTWQATIGGGTLLADVTQRLHDNGNRAMAHGTCPQVGIGGHATIGGLGPTSRMWGAALDHVEEVEVVLANSTVVRASATQNQDVLWAMKGAGAGFGIITEFKVRTEPEPGSAVLYSYTMHAGDAASKATAFKQWQELISDPTLSRSFASQFIVTAQFGAMVTGTFFGTQEEYNSLNISSRLPAATESTIVMQDWLGVVGHWAEDEALKIVGGIPSNFYAKSLAYTPKDLISNATVDKLFSYMDTADKGGALWFLIFDLEGGATNDVAPDATSYGHRNALFYHQTYAVNLFGAISDTTRNFVSNINQIIVDGNPNGNQGAYAGYVDPALGADYAKQYWGANVPKLEQIKATIDPNDVFHNPQSVRPASGSARLVKRTL